MFQTTFTSRRLWISPSGSRKWYARRQNQSWNTQTKNSNYLWEEMEALETNWRWEQWKRCWWTMTKRRENATSICWQANGSTRRNIWSLKAFCRTVSYKKADVESLVFNWLNFRTERAKEAPKATWQQFDPKCHQPACAAQIHIQKTNAKTQQWRLQSCLQQSSERSKWLQWRTLWVLQSKQELVTCAQSTWKVSAFEKIWT